MKIHRMIGLFFVWGLVSISSSSAATRYVNVSNATPAAPFTNWGMAAVEIQPAIDAAASGDEILVAPGTYDLPSSEIYVPPEKTLTLRSTHRREAIINAWYQSRGMRIDGTNSVIEGFTVRSGNAGFAYGGGIMLVRAATVRDCLVTGNWAAAGAGITVSAGATNSLVEDCTIEGNTATNGAGGGVVLYENSHGRIHRCLIRDNGADYGGGVFITEGGSVSNCWIIGNRAGIEHGGGVYMHASGTTNSATLVNSVIFSNSATQHGGGVYCAGPPASFSPIVNCTIVFNEAGADGGGAHAYWTRFVNDILYFNEAPTNANLKNGDLGCVISNCCTTSNYFWPNITNAPAFVDAGAGDFRLATASFCIDAGTTNGAPGTDIEGKPRPRIGTPVVLGFAATNCDIGAYEYGFHFNSIETASSNAMRLRWDVQDVGRYRVDVATNAAADPLHPAWLSVMAYTQATIIGAGQYAVHTATVTNPTPPMPANATFRLRVDRATVGKRSQR